MRKRLNYLMDLLKSEKPYDENDDVNRKKLAQMYKPVNLLGKDSANNIAKN